MMSYIIIYTLPFAIYKVYKMLIHRTVQSYTGLLFPQNILN